MKYLGIDYGDKRIGVAISDPQGRVAFPRQVVFNSGEKTLKDLKKIVEDEQVSRIVIGLPQLPGVGETDQTKKVRNFAEALGKVVAIGVDFGDELLTTRLVEKGPIKQEHTDASAAALILQSYLDKLT